MAQAEEGSHGPRRRAAFAWGLFDWANSPFPTVVVTFVFAVYFQRAVVGDPVRATVLWSQAIALSALAVAVLAPLLGAVADAGARRKPWLAACSLLTIVASFGLWFATPGPESIWLVLVLVAVGNFGFELGMVFYNAMLPDLAKPGRLGRLSGWAWGLGYAGGLTCLVVALYGLIQADPPPFGLDSEAAEPVRAVAILVALWFAAFAWPLFAFTPESALAEGASRRPFGAAIVQGARQLVSTLRRLREYRQIGRFLIARMLYIDGLNTLFAFGGLYAAGSFDMEMSEVLQFGIALNVTAGLGAVAFGWVDDRFGAKPTIVFSLMALIVASAAILTVESKAAFWALGLVIGVFMGPVQSASRSMMARLAPVELRTEMFGLFALSGKATSFVGPWLVGVITVLAGSQRVGMAAILFFFVAGLLLLLTVREPGNTQPPH